MPTTCLTAGCSVIPRIKEHRGYCHTCWTCAQQLSNSRRNSWGYTPRGNPTPLLAPVATTDEWDEELALPGEVYIVRGRTFHARRDCVRVLVTATPAEVVREGEARPCPKCCAEFLASAAAHEDGEERCVVLLTPYKVDEDTAEDWQLDETRLAERLDALEAFAAAAGRPVLNGPGGEPVVALEVPWWLAPSLAELWCSRPGPADRRLPSDAEVSVYTAYDPGLGWPASRIEHWEELEYGAVQERIEGIWTVAEGVAS